MNETVTIINPEAEARARYEADRKTRPTYHDGTPRKRWDQLTEIARQSWYPKKNQRLISAPQRSQNS